MCMCVLCLYGFICRTNTFVYILCKHAIHCDCVTNVEWMFLLSFPRLQKHMESSVIGWNAFVSFVQVHLVTDLFYFFIFLGIQKEGSIR